MSRVKKIAASGAAVALGAVALAAVPASSAGAADTNLNAQLIPGVLSITAPTSFVYTAQTLTVGGTYVFSGTIGTTTGGVTTPAATPVVVSDARGGVNQVWTASAGVTALTNGTDTIAATDVTYSAGAVTVVSNPNGTATSVGSVALVASPATVPVVNKTAGNGVTRRSWEPTVSFTAPATSVAGTFTGVLTNSVA